MSLKASTRNLMFDLAAKREIFDEEHNRTVPNKEANEVLRMESAKHLGLNEKSTERDIKRALKKDSGKEFFEVVEEILDNKISTGWKDNEFFEKYVETRNLKDGDANEFWTEEDIILNVAKVSGDHHDLIMQKLNEGTSYNIPTSVYAVKVGTDLRMFLLGRRDWSQFIDACAKAFVKAVKDTMYAEFMNMAKKFPVPSSLRGTGAITSGVKDTFDEIISKVSAVNECDVVIMGTKTALKKLNALAVNTAGSITWISDKDKDAISSTGILGDYEGTPMIEIPQRFADKAMTQELVDSTEILIFPAIDFKPIKFVDYGETILEVTEAGQTMNDQQSYEVQRRMGIGSVCTRYFGEWDLDA